MTIAAFLTAQLPARTMSSQCCYFLLYLPKSVLEGACIYECVYECVCVRESVGFCWTWRNTPLHLHKGTLSPAGQRHLSRTKETKYDVGVCSLLELWYGGEKRVCVRASPTSGSESLNWAESIHSRPKNCPGSTSAMHVHSYICGRPLQHCPPHINFLFLEPPSPSPSLSLSQTSCVSHTQTLLVSQIYERPPKSTHFSIFYIYFVSVWENKAIRDRVDNRPSLYPTHLLTITHALWKNTVI